MPDKTIVLVENDITKLLKNKLKLKNKELFDEGDFQVQITLEIEEKIYKQIDNFPRLQDALNKPASKLYKKFVSDVEALLEKKDREITSHKLSADNAKGLIDEELSELKEKFGDDVEQDVREEWAKYNKKKKSLLKARLKFIRDNVLTVGSVVVAATGIASSGGLALFLGIHTIVSGSFTVFNEMKGLFKEADQLRKEINKDIRMIEKEFKKKIGNSLDTITTIVFNQLLGLGLATIGTTKERIGKYETKLLSIDLKADKISGKLKDLLDLQEKYQKNLIDIEEELEKGPGIERSDTLFENFKKIKDHKEVVEEKTILIVDKITKINDEIDVSKEWLPNAKASVKALADKKNPTLEKFEQCLKLALHGAKIESGLGKLAEEAAAQCKQLIPIAKNIQGYAKTIESLV